MTADYIFSMNKLRLQTQLLHYSSSYLFCMKKSVLQSKHLVATSLLTPTPFCLQNIPTSMHMPSLACFLWENNLFPGLNMWKRRAGDRKWEISWFLCIISFKLNSLNSVPVVLSLCQLYFKTESSWSNGLMK